MLVLTRKEGQKIVIKTSTEIITITLVLAGSYAVRLGFEAPKHVIIHREELLDEHDNTNN